MMKVIGRWPSRRVVSLFSSLLAIIFIAIAIWQPHWQWSRTVYHYSFVFDISQSMNTRDYQHDGHAVDRLGIAKLAAMQALTQLPCGSTLGLGLYTANNTYQLFNPLEVCEHYSVISTSLQRIDWQMAWANDSMIQRGLFAAIKLLEQAEYPPQLVFFTDGDELPKTDKQPAFMHEAGKPGGFIIGVGDLTASPVPHLDEKGNITDYWTLAEATGDRRDAAKMSSLFLSRLDEANLLRLAEITGMNYRQLEQPEQLIDWLRHQEFGQERQVMTDMRWLFALLALGFCVLPVVYRRRG